MSKEAISGRKLSGLAHWSAAWRFAQRDLRGGFRNFRVFLVALILGVAGLAAVGSVVSSIRAGLESRGAELLGGDIEIELVYRFAEEAELAAMRAEGDVSATVDLRSMARAGGDAAVVQAKAVDGAYPLVGEAVLEPAIGMEAALAKGADGRFGAIVEPSLMTRLGLQVGDEIKLGALVFELRAALLQEPDRAVSGVSFGPRIMVSTDAVEPAGLAREGTLFETEYRIRLNEDADVGAARARLAAAFPDAGWRLRDKSNGAPGVERVVGQIGSFLSLVGLAALAVAGVGVGGSVRSYLDKKTDAIATLKTLGADGAMILRVYLLQIAVVTAIGLSAGLALGAGAVVALAPIMAERLPVPAEFGVYAKPLIEAAIYGALTAFLFALWPLARAKEIRAAGLFRDVVSPSGALPRPAYIVSTLALAALLAGAAIWFAENKALATGFVGGVAAVFVVLMLAGVAVAASARGLARGAVGRMGPEIRLALASLGGARSETRSAVLALGLGLTTLTAIGLVDANLRRFVSEELPENAPAYFVIDIQKAEIERFSSAVSGYEGVTRVETAPMLRGVITAVNDQSVEEWRAGGNVAEGFEWVLRGDRGVTYSLAPPEGTTITEGEWWPADYSGEPLISFGDEQGRGIGLKLGDKVTVNILGRAITGRVASFRDVQFRSAGINFLMVFDPSILKGAPHAFISTIYGEEPVDGAYLRDVADAFPAATAVPTKDVIERIKSAVSDVADAARYGALATLATGLVVLVGAAAAGQQARIYESSIMKTLGARRRSLIWALSFRAALLGVFASVVALVAGGAAAWAVTTFALDAEFRFDLSVALSVLGLGLAATLLAGAVFAYGPLSARPARVLRARA